MSSITAAFATIILIVVVHLSLGAPIVKRSATTQVITYDQFLAIQIGWTRQQTTEYLNNYPGVVQSETAIGISHIQIVQYMNTNPIAVVILTFTNNLLMAKGQSQLNVNRYLITLEQYNQITIGMTKEQVKSSVGNGGQVLAESINSVEVIGYTGSTNVYATATITFSQGTVFSKSQFGLYDQS